MLAVVGPAFVIQLVLHCMHDLDCLQEARHELEERSRACSDERAAMNAAVNKYCAMFCCAMCIHRVLVVVAYCCDLLSHSLDDSSSSPVASIP